MQYGHDKSSPIDILGYCMSIAAKITSITDPNGITIGEDVYNMIHPTLKSRFRELKICIEDWKYTNRQTGQLYKLFDGIILLWLNQFFLCLIRKNKINEIYPRIIVWVILRSQLFTDDYLITTPQLIVIKL